MSESYEAIYEDGHLQWLGAQPGAGRHRLRITIIDGNPPQHSPQGGASHAGGDPGCLGSREDP
jgi:hypothetical protein